MNKIILIVFGILILNSCTSDTSETSNIIPISPTNLSGIVVSNTQIDLFWEDQSNNENGFKIERKTQNGTFETIGTTDLNISTFTDSNLTPGTIYIYRVISYNAIGNAENYSNQLILTTSSNITFEDVTVDIPVNNRFWLGVDQDKFYSVQMPGIGKNMDISHNSTNAEWFYSGSIYRRYIIISQYKQNTIRKKFINNIYDSEEVIESTYIMNVEAFWNGQPNVTTPYIVKCKTISEILIDHQNEEWFIVNF